MGGNPQDRLSGRLPIPPPRPLPPTPIPVRTPAPATPPCFPPSPTYFTAAAVLYRSPSPSSAPSHVSPSPATLQGSMRRSSPTPMTRPASSYYTADISSTAGSGGGPPTTFTALASSLPQPQPAVTHSRRWGIRLPQLPQFTPQHYILLPLLLAAFVVTLATLTLAATSLARYSSPRPAEVSLTSTSTLITTSGVLCLLSLLWGVLFFKHSSGRWGVVAAVVGVGVAVVGVGYGREKWDETEWWSGEGTGEGGTGLREWACRRRNWGVGWEREGRVCGDLDTQYTQLDVLLGPVPVTLNITSSRKPPHGTVDERNSALMVSCQAQYIPFGQLRHGGSSASTPLHPSSLSPQPQPPALTTTAFPPSSLVSLASSSSLLHLPSAHSPTPFSSPPARSSTPSISSPITPTTAAAGPAGGGAMPAVLPPRPHHDGDGNRLHDHRKRGRRGIRGAGLLVSSMLLSTASAQCVSLASSKICPAFKEAKVSTGSAMFGQLYGSRFGCSNLTLSDTADKYARFTRTYLCSRMVQDSKDVCGLTDKAATPVCAETCANFARSEQIIASDPNTCGQSRQETLAMIRSDFAICSNPSESLAEGCISGIENEKENCGYSNNLPGLCLYCSQSTADSTDTCCYTAQAETRCQGVELPEISDLPPLITDPADPKKKSSGLSGGAIAGITVGTLVFVALVVGLLLFFLRRRRNASEVGRFNQPPPGPRNQPSMSFATVGPTSQGRGYEVLGGGRVARMSALETTETRDSAPASPAVVLTHQRSRLAPSQSGTEGSPGSHRRGSPGHPEPRTRNASLSSTSILMDPNSPLSASEKHSSPEYGNPQSEQLPFFKDYYSSGDIHPGDRVSTLWAYSPRAPDEFELERGDMLKVIGIWDDGWATGILLPERAEDYIKHREKHDSGISASQKSNRRTPSPAVGDIKAFPLVCVCLPDHWQKTIDSEAANAHVSSDEEFKKHRDTAESPERKAKEKGLFN
ncbi:hypothetical protein EX30DRAFT_350353 [Ascodesmis nigricans]|uniref:SH3 domain-containing protein n=1 Tax=Ascodesmis nigricans TaxID=341454 RepID=A0A4V3SI92_9PEZI|nr:hypothetical protein EX30DRAFT_350353 [Ascodesmis nigricans]